MPGGHGNIDHLAVAPTGVFVIDAKDIKGKVRVANPLFAAAKQQAGVPAARPPKPQSRLRAKEQPHARWIATSVT